MRPANRPMKLARWLVATVALLGLVGCPTPAVRPTQPLADPVTVTDRDVRAGMIAELVDEVLKSYERDEPPELGTSMLPPQVGASRIGVGPGDVLIGPELERAPTRWPLDVDPRIRTEARSKRLDVYLAQDGTAAWVSDEISWRIPTCGRTAAIPLRLTALFARDGDRWVPVFEHLSFGHRPVPSLDGKLRGASIKSAVVSRDLADDLSRLLPPLLTRNDRISQVMATGPEALVLGPAGRDEWRNEDVLRAELSQLALTADDRRVGTVGRTPGTSTVAFWVGNFVANLPARTGFPAGKARMRGTFVFEKRRVVKVTVDGKEKTAATATRPELESCGSTPEGCRWVIVQAHLSQPIDDGPDPTIERALDRDLATIVFGTALISPKPLAVGCDELRRATVPAAAPGGLTPARRPATQSP